jgi:hypothetical protein
MRVRLVFALSLVALLAVPTVADAAFRQFVTPSRNIHCGGDTRFLRCDVLQHTWKAPKKPASCEFDWGGSIGMTRRGRVKFQCVSDSEFNRHVLRYGHTWHNGRFTCTSRRTGLRCRNAAGHGFRVSRQKLVRF